MPAPPDWNTRHLIDGALVAGQGAEYRVENPATEEVLATLREPSPDQVEAAILAARRAFESGEWRDPAFRAEVITRMADLLEARKAEFLAALVADIGTPVSISEFLQIGGPLDPATLIGPLISCTHRARVEGHIADALADGGQVLAGGGRPDRDRGWYHNGTLIGGLDNHARLARTELFGPVAMVLPYDGIDDLVGLSNDSDFGLAATIFGPTELALRVAPRLRAGTVQINGGGAMRVDSVLAGWKQSGLGREWGEDGIREFLVAQHIQWTV